MLKTLSDRQEFYQESFDRQAGEFGELPDGYTRLVLNFYHQIVAKLPDLASRYKTYKGAIVASTALLSDVSMAVLRRIHDGHNSEQILQEISAEEVIAAPKLVREDDNRRFKKLRKLIRRQIAKAKS